MQTSIVIFHHNPPTTTPSHPENFRPRLPSRQATSEVAKAMFDVARQVGATVGTQTQRIWEPTERDAKIIEAVMRMRCVTSEQITRLLFPVEAGKERSEKITSQAKLRLTKLTREGYIHQVQRTHAPAIYWLDFKGLRYLQGLGLASPDMRLYPTERDVTASWLVHHLKTVDVWIAVELSCKKHGLTLVDYRDQRAMYRAHRQDKVRITIGDQAEDITFIPDGYFHIRTLPTGEYPNGRDYYHLLEVDMGTETLEATTKGARDIARKLRGYLAYMPKNKDDHTSLYEQRYGVNLGRVLWVVPGEKRLGNIKDLIFKLGGMNRYWLTTLARMSEQDMLTGPIWTMVPEAQLDPRTRKPLMDPETGAFIPKKEHPLQPLIKFNTGPASPEAAPEAST